MQNPVKRAFATAACGAAALAPVLASGQAAHAQAASDPVYYVSGNGSDTAHHGTSCADGFATISHAIAVASSGDTVVVCASSVPYKQGGITVPSGKSITLRGRGTAIIDAGGKPFGILVASDRTTVRGLTVEHAGSGIEVVANRAVVEGNHLTRDGNGIYLLGSSLSRVTFNSATRNSLAGIVLQDNGRSPCAGNSVSTNIASGNSRTAGIYLLGSGSRSAGVFGNVIYGNFADVNGAASGRPAPGISLSNEFRFGGNVHGNTLASNEIRQNGGPGISLTSFGAGNMSGNLITRNAIGTNNVAPAGPLTPGPDQPVFLRTTGIFLESFTRQAITVQQNLIADDVFGVVATRTFGPAQIYALNKFVNVLFQVRILP